MKKHIVYSLSAMLLVFVMAAFSTVYALETQADKKAEAVEQVQSMQPASAGITVSGTINDSNQLIDDQGKAFELSENTDEGLEVKALVGQKVELKGTVMEEEGQNIMEVQEYRIIGDK